MKDYGSFSKEELKNCLVKIEQRLGGQHLKRALEELDKGNLHEVADISLSYYDKAYSFQHEKRKMKDIFFIESETADPAINAEKIISYTNSQLQTKRNDLIN